MNLRFPSVRYCMPVGGFDPPSRFISPWSLVKMTIVFSGSTRSSVPIWSSMCVMLAE